ncbi:MAG: bacillithiol system redox-active protein YtxJ [Gemmatimonadota bacterium]|nr:MAG: bacillithiol system redox-active protein YtxJ [Gemmatimonadota bacterium]
MLFGRDKKAKQEQDRATDNALNEVLQADLAIIYKHSTLCPTSALAMRQVQDFMTRNPAVPVYVVDVIRDRKLARQLAGDLRIQHESPQAIVLRNGVPRAHCSHYDITADQLETWCSTD